MDDHTRARFTDVEESFVTGAISLYINKYTYGLQKQDQMDLFQEVYVRIREKLPTLVGKFRAKFETRKQTRKNFERWLHTSIRNQLIDLLKSGSGRYGPFNVVSMPGPMTCDLLQDKDRDATVRKWEEEALNSLSDLERQVLHARLVDNTSYQLLSSELEIPVKRLYKIHFRGILKFRAKMIQNVIERAFVQYNGPEPIEHFRHLIDKRCKSQHACYLYYLACPKAKDSITLSGEFGKPVKSEQIVSSMKKLTHFVQEALDDWELYVSLDRCLWASS